MKHGYAIPFAAAVALVVLTCPIVSCIAASVTATDDGTAVYGACNGVAIDFDATSVPEAVWTPGLTSGQTYGLNSVAIKNASGNTGDYYLGVYTGFSGGILSGFQGVSDAANNFSTSPNGWLTFTFSNLNYTVLVDSTVGSGSGMLYFIYQSGTAALTSPNVTLATDKFATDTYMTNSLASIIAYGGLVANRSPQYQATITPVSPKPPPAAPTGVSATASNTAVTLTWMTSSNATSYNVKRSLTSGGGYTTVSTVNGTNVTNAGLSYSTTYFYVVSAVNSGGESANSSEVSATTGEVPAPVAVTNSLGVSVVVGSNGVYQVVFPALEWTFAGYLAQALTNRTIGSGSDNIGAYSEIAFNYTSAVPHTAAIRLYNNSPVVTFNDTTLASGPNDLGFPYWIAYPAVPSHLTFGESGFGEFTFSNLHDDSPWLFFNTNHDTFIISAATNYMVASTVMKNGSSISCGINSAIPQLPAGFAHRVILAAQNGINGAYTTWGNALMALAGKTAPTNDAAVELEKLGYWTDNGATYYYNTNAPLGIENTLLALKNEYAAKGVPLAYVQLDSWWYKKGSNAVWNSGDGIYLYEEDPTLFPDGLAGFQQRLGLPLVTHSRWVDPSSPYRTNYTMSADVITDPRYWNDRMAYLKSCGVVTFEQDWLSSRGVPAMNLTNGGAAYLGNMQAAAAANGINMQYCMPQCRDLMQGSLYGNLMTSRVSWDDFNSARWQAFIYDSRLVQALGFWPWCDVFMSAETRNLLVSTLSAGPVGPGDPLNAVNAENLKQSVRADGVIVKPDVPLVPTEETYVNDALGLGRPFIATTHTDHGNSRALYVFAFGEDASQLNGSFKLSDFGIISNAFVYDYFAATGTVVNAGAAFNFTTTLPNDFNGGSYFIAAPIGASGLALIGDSGKFVTRGRKRVAQLTDNGTLTATVTFAAGEQSVTLVGYSPNYPALEFSQGSGGMVSYNPAAGLFTLQVVPDETGTAVVQLATGGSPPAVPATPTGLSATAISSSQIDVSWSASSGAAGYDLKRSTNSGGPYTHAATTLATNYSDTGLVSGTMYYYVVSAINGGGESTNSAEAWTATQFAPVPAIYEAEDDTVATRSGVAVASNNGGYSGTGYGDYSNASGDYIEWKVYAPSAGLFTVVFRYANGGAGDRPLDLNVNGAVVNSGLSFPPTGGWSIWQLTAVEQIALNAGTNTVRITDIGSSGGNVDNLQLTEVPPAAPTGLMAMGVSSNQIHLSWTASDTAAKYVVKRSMSGGASHEILLFNVAATTCSDTNGLIAGTRYYYVVSAVNSGGESGDSNEASAVPSAAVAPDEYVIADFSFDGETNLSFTLSDSVPGHDYRIWATDSLTSPDWQPAGDAQAGTGSNLDFIVPVDGRTSRFFKLDVRRQ